MDDELCSEEGNDLLCSIDKFRAPEINNIRNTNSEKATNPDYKPDKTQQNREYESNNRSIISAKPIIPKKTTNCDYKPEEKNDRDLEIREPVHHF